MFRLTLIVASEPKPLRRPLSVKFVVLGRGRTCRHPYGSPSKGPPEVNP